MLNPDSKWNVQTGVP